MTQGRIRPGDRAGTEPLAAVPSLDQLAATPEIASTLSYRTLLEARRATQRLLADLDHAVALATPPVAAPTPSDGHELLSPAEAAAFLRQSLRWLKRHGRHLPGYVQLSSPKAVAYQRVALEKYVRQRAHS